MNVVNEEDQSKNKINPKKHKTMRKFRKFKKRMYKKYKKRGYKQKYIKVARGGIRL